MPNRERAPLGAPCWADLWTSDVDGSRRFYAELFGWEAQEPDPEFGGYFMFTLDGRPIAGAMGDMGDMKANDTWKVYLATADLAAALQATDAAGGQVVFPPMAVADLGQQSVIVDASGATVGLWQPGTFAGFSVLAERGAPSWFELHTRDYPAAVAFYEEVLAWQTEVLSDTAEFRYTTMSDPDGEGQLAGIFDATGDLAEGVPSNWIVYWGVDDVAASLEAVRALGGSVVRDMEETPFGTMATVTDPCGATFKLHRANS